MILVEDTLTAVKTQKNGVHQWLFSQVASFYEEGIETFISRYNKCLNGDENYVEKII